MKADELRSKSLTELNNELLALLRDSFNLRVQQGTGVLAKFHLLTVVKKNVARVKTIINQKKAKGEK
jgi:large subunit ribosomal protein L29